VSQTLTPDPAALADLGWSPFFAEQIQPEDAGLLPARIAVVHRSRLMAETGAGQVRLEAAKTLGEMAVGDWALIDPETRVARRRLERASLLRRRTEAAHVPQLIAANIDTLFIVTSCNDDFSPARLERYLAVVNQSGATPVIVLTKADQVGDTALFHSQAAALQRDLAVVAVDGTDPGAAAILAPWCGPGRTVALIGSSGVGKSTLLNTLAQKAEGQAQETGAIRDSDAKGRHTTTARSLHAIAGGGWIIDTPGMRTLHLGDVAEGLDQVFGEITELAPSCRFRNCTHQHEPNCAVRAAVVAGTVSADRLDRWHKLTTENADHTPDPSGPKGAPARSGSGRRR
jgi:ribosome biogenesis GTPase / thiamine phosphate phosphatase